MGVERALTERGLTSFFARVRRELRTRYEADLLDALEVPRGALHFAFLSTWAYLAYVRTPRSALLMATVAVTALVFVFELIKTADHPAVATLVRILRPFLRGPEIEVRMTSAAGTMLALIVAVVAFPLPAASLAVAFLAAGDPASRATRKLASRFGLSAPIVQAMSFAVMTFVCFVLGALFSQLSWLQLLLASTAASFAETFLEVRVTPRLTLDDNFFIPVFSGLALTTFFL